MANERRSLITAATFRSMAQRGAKAADFADKAVLKAGLIDRSRVKAPAAVELPIDVVPAGREIGFILSNANMDREGDRIAVDGWNLEPYKSNPVVLWAHDHDDLPVARAIDTYIDATQLKAIDEFVDGETYPFADTVYKMLVGRYLNACSVGFQPNEWEMSDTGVNFQDQELLEHSVCPVPAHPEALVIARSKGIDVAPLKAWAERTLDLFQHKSAGDGDKLLRAQFERLRAQADPSGRKLFSVLRSVRLPMTPEEQRALQERAGAAAQSVLDVLDEEKEAGSVLPDVPAVPLEDAPADLEAYKTMGDMLATVGTACSIVMDSVNVLLGMPESTAGVEELPVDDTPILGQEDDFARDRRHLESIVTNCASGAESLTTIGRMAESRLEKLPPAPSADEDPAGAPAPSGPTPIPVAEAAAEVVTVKRWNPRLSKAFDVSREQFEAASNEEGLVSKYLGVELKFVERRKTVVPAFRMGSWLSAIDDELVNWQVDDIRNLDYHGKETSPVYEVIQLNSTLQADFLVDGMRFARRLEDGHEQRMMLRVEPNWYGIDVTLYGLRETGTASRTLSALGVKAKALNFLKGEAFALCGEFLPRTTETFDDLFLDAKNQGALQRIARLLNERGASLENRGVLATGPPGTGKTLSARILRNLVNCTFIWVSSRDFHYSGAFGGITEAFDLARECATGDSGSIIVFEDIDNWLGPISLDLLKTEMDGVSRSSGVVTLMTTNYPELLPPALLDRPGRFHDVLSFGLPDAKVRGQMLAKWLPGMDEATSAKAVSATDGYSGAHIRELARFAAIIGEQDEVELSVAVERALAKLAEQRELITQTQTHGSRYRAEDLGLRKAARRQTREALPAVEKSSEPIVPARRPVEQAELLGKVPEMLACCSALLGGTLSDAQRREVVSVQRDMFSIQLTVNKVGRVLSAANEDRIKRASSLLTEVLSQLETAPSAPEPPVEEAIAGQVLMLDEETRGREVIDVPGFDSAVVRDTLQRVMREHIMQATGRVD